MAGDPASRARQLRGGANASNEEGATARMSAALGHVGDAGRVPDHSPDQSWHLAGVAPERVREAGLGGGWLDETLGHELTEVGGRAPAVALAIDTGAARYRNRVPGLGARCPVLADWRPACRYELTRSRATTARSLVEAAAQLTDELASELWMDGRPGEVR